MQTKTIIYGVELNINDIIETIDNHFKSETNLLFVCDYKLAEFIYNYIIEGYNVIEDDGENVESLDNKYDEYYVSFYFDKNGVNFFVESAKGINDKKYKLHDIDEYTDYYICVDIDEDIVFDKLLGDNCSYNWVSVDLGDVDKDNENVDEVDKVVCDDNCEDCEITPEICEVIKLIEEYADIIENIDCPACLRNSLYDLFVKGKNVGWNDHKDMIREVNENNE